MADANILVENSDLPGVRQAQQFNTKLPLNLIGSNATLTVAGATSLGALTVSSFTNTGSTVGSLSKVTALTTTAAPTVAQSGTIFLLNAAAGFTVTLPAPVVGCRFTFIVETSVTSSNLKIITDAATTLLQGVITSATTTASVFQGNGTSHVAVTMNGTTTGGLLGTQLDFYCIAASGSPSGLWQVYGTNFTSSTTATPFTTS